MDNSTSSTSATPCQMTALFAPGAVLDQRYEVIKRLSEGTERGIYLCHHLAIPDQRVVLKVLHRPRIGENFKTTAERFEREVLAAKAVEHPNVAKVYDFIRHGGFLAYTMEYISGGDLSRLIEQDAEIDFSLIVEILAQLCSGVYAINCAGIIHRELKPENILLTTDGQVKISDFGVAKLSNQPTLTVPGALVGTIDYLSPEYVTKGTINAGIDVYSVGIIAYELLTKQIPYQSDDIMDCLQRRINNEPIDVKEYNRSCPSGLCQIVARALKRNPAERYQSSLEMLSDLARLNLSAKAKKIALEAGATVVTNYMLGGGVENSREYPLGSYLRDNSGKDWSDLNIEPAAFVSAESYGPGAFDRESSHADSFLELELLKATNQRPRKKRLTPMAESLLTILVVALTFYGIGYYLFTS